MTGLTAGLGSAVGASKIAQPLIQQALKRCVAEAGVNLAGEVTAVTLDKLVSEETPDSALQAGDPQLATKAILTGPARAALTGCISGILGVPISKLGSGVVRKGVDVAVGAGMSYADARLSGQGNTEALVAAVQGTATHLAISHAQQHNSRPGAKKVTHKAPSKTSSNTHEPSALPKPDIPAAQHAAEATAGSKPDHPSAPSKTAHRETAAAHAAEILTRQIKGGLAADVAPAILKEDAIAKKPTAGGHEVVVTKQGVAKCSPSPCPVIHVEYAKELAEHPKLKQWNDEIQALRKTDPTKAADAADRLIRTLEAARSNTVKSASSQNGDPEPSFALHIGEKRAEQIRSGEKNFAIDRALTFDIDEVLPGGGCRYQVPT